MLDFSCLWLVIIDHCFIWSIMFDNVSLAVRAEKVRKSDIKCEQKRENRIKRRRYTREKERES